MSSESLAASTEEQTTRDDRVIRAHRTINNYRPHSIIVRPPGIDEKNARPDHDHREPLAAFIAQELDRQNIDGIELLAESRSDAVAYYLVPRMTHADKKSRLNAPPQTGLDAFGDRAATPESTLTSIAADLEDHLSAAWTIAIGAVDFAPIGRGLVIGTRLLLPENRSLTRPPYTSIRLFEDLVNRLKHSDKPFLVQSIIRDATNGYQFTGRLAVPYPTHTLMSIEDKIDHFESGLNFDISNITEEMGLETNHDIPVHEFGMPVRNGIRRKTAKYLRRSHSDRALTLHRGINEYRDLLRGKPGSDTLYSTLDKYGVIPINEFKLAHVGTLIPLYYQDSPWNKVFGRGPSRLDVHRIIQDGMGTQESLGTDVEAPVDSGSLGTLEGGLSHDALCRFASRVLPRDHDAVSAAEYLDQEAGQSKPDLLITMDESPINGEVEVKNKSKGAKTISNYAKARADGREIWYIVDEADVSSYRDILLQPWNETLDTGALLYTTSRTVTLDSGLKPVLPPGVPEARWILRGTTLTLKSEDGDILGTGSACDPIANVDFDAPRYENGGTHRIIDTDGQTITEGPTKSAVLDEYTEIAIPQIPPAPYLTEGVSIYAKHGDRLEEQSLVLDELQEGDSSDIYQAGLELISETHLITGEDAHIPYSQFQDEVKRFFDTFGVETPNNTYIGRNLPDEIDVDPKNASDRKLHADWAVDPDLDSPM